MDEDQLNEQEDSNKRRIESSEGRIEELEGRVTGSTNENKNQGLECVDFFISKCVEGILETKSTLKEKLKSNFLFRSFRAFSSSSSMVKEFAYWLQQYALDPTNQRVASMFAQYQTEFKKQVSTLLKSKNGNSSSLISSLCTQLLGNLKK